MILCIILLFLSVIAMGVFFYFLHKRVEKLSTRVIMIMQWCDTLRENEETIMNDIKRLYHEFQTFQKDYERRR